MDKLPYEIRRSGETVCASTLPMCGYPARLLRQMMADGYRYYEDGKLVRSCPGKEDKRGMPLFK